MTPKDLNFKILFDTIITLSLMIKKRPLTFFKIKHKAGMAPQDDYYILCTLTLGGFRMQENTEIT